MRITNEYTEAGNELVSEKVINRSDKMLVKKVALCSETNEK